MSVTEPEELVDLRCPYGARQLLAKIVRQGGKPEMDQESNLLELACRDCARSQRREDPTILRVVHRYNVLGELVESRITRH